MNCTFVTQRSASRMSESDSAALLAARFDGWLPATPLAATPLAVGSLAVFRWSCGLMLAVTLAAALGISTAASGEVISGAILGSGINANLSTTFQRDSNWRIVAVPVGYTPPDSQTVPYDAYVPRTVASAWLGSGGVSGPQTGYSTGGTTYHWIAPDSDVTRLSTVLAPVDTTNAATWYKWIAAQTFTIPANDTSRLFCQWHDRLYEPQATDHHRRLSDHDHKHGPRAVLSDRQQHQCEPNLPGRRHAYCLHGADRPGQRHGRPHRAV